VWLYVALAIAVLIVLRLLARAVFVGERAAVQRSERRASRQLRERLDRYTAGDAE
jgi:hypothetical protein